MSKCIVKDCIEKVEYIRLGKNKELLCDWDMFLTMEDWRVDICSLKQGETRPKRPTFRKIKGE